MRVWTRTPSWCRNLALPQLRVQPSGLCTPHVGARKYSSVVAFPTHDTRRDSVTQSKRGAQRQSLANCRLSQLGPISALPSPQLRHCSSAHMSSLAKPGAPDEYRLPTNVKPVHYNVTIKTDLEDQTFEGFVRIE